MEESQDTLHDIMLNSRTRGYCKDLDTENMSITTFKLKQTDTQKVETTCGGEELMFTVVAISNVVLKRLSSAKRAKN